MPNNIGDKIAGILAVIIIGVAFFGWSIKQGWSPDDWLPDTPEQHQERLTCEMNQMTMSKMQAADAEAYCAKEIEAERIYQRKLSVK